MSALEIVGWRRFHQLGGWMFASINWPNNDPLAGEPEPLTPLAPAQAEIERLNAVLGQARATEEDVRARAERWKARALAAEAALSAEVDHHAHTARELGQAEERVRVLEGALRRIQKLNEYGSPERTIATTALLPRQPGATDE